jgi:hypothetical protein
MPTMVEIDGVEVDIDSPCDVVAALRAAELKIATGAGVVMTRFGRDNEVRWDRGNLSRLGDLILKYERECDRKSGRRTRFAKRMRFVR